MSQREKELENRLRRMRRIFEDDAKKDCVEDDAEETIQEIADEVADKLEDTIDKKVDEAVSRCMDRLARRLPEAINRYIDESVEDAKDKIESEIDAKVENEVDAKIENEISTKIEDIIQDKLESALKDTNLGEDGEDLKDKIAEVIANVVDAIGEEMDDLRKECGVASKVNEDDDEVQENDDLEEDDKVEEDDDLEEDDRKETNESLRSKAYDILESVKDHFSFNEYQNIQESIGRKWFRSKKDVLHFFENAIDREPVRPSGYVNESYAPSDLFVDACARKLKV